MAISSSMQNNILALTAGMFNMSAGGTYLTSFADYVTNVQTTYKLSDDAAMAELARALVKSDVFKAQMAGKVTAAAQANAILANFGLTGDAALVASTVAAIEGFGTTNVDGKMAALVWGYTKALTQDKDAMAKYPAATAALAAKVATAVETSVTNPVTTTDVAVLKSVFSGSTGSNVVMTSAIDVLTGTNAGDTFNANGATLNNGDVIYAGAGADKLVITLNAETATGFRAESLETVEIRAAGVSSVVMTNVPNVTTVTSAQTRGDLTVTDIQSNGGNINLADTRSSTHNFVFDADKVAGATNVNLAVSEITAGSTVRIADENGAGIETVKLSSNGGLANTITDINFSTANKTITIDGNTDLTVVYALQAPVTTVDAAALAAKLNINMSAVGAGDVTFKGAVGNTTVTFGTAANAKPSPCKTVTIL